MKNGVSIKEYKGMYTVEYNTKSIGITLLATWDKAQANTERDRIRDMTRYERRKYLMTR